MTRHSLTRQSSAAQANRSAAAPRQSRWAEATAIRRRAADLLPTPVPAQASGTHATDYRMVLVVALILILTMTMALYLAVAGLYMAGEWAFGAIAWLEPASDALYALLLVLLVLPLLGAAFRMAARMTSAQLSPTTDLPLGEDDLSPPTVADLFYPFTSPVAYGRTMLVAGETLVWFMCIFGLPMILWRVAELPLAYLTRSAPIAYGIVLVIRPVLCVLIGLAMLLLSGLRAGFGYYIFTHPHMSAQDASRYLRSRRRSMISVLCLRLSFAGWAALSLLGLGVPFILHVGPLGWLSAAVYAHTLPSRTD